MTDYKQLCADLVAWAEKTSAHYYSEPRVLIRARAALAEPEPEGPTDEELLEINYGAYCPGTDEVNDEDDSSWQYTSDYIRWLDENGTPEEQEAYTAKGLRAVFKAGRRWGRPAPAPQPIPVTKRLPGPKDCQFNPGATIGFCWCWTPPENSFSPGCWALWPLEWHEDATHWLPANALPLPQ